MWVIHKKIDWVLKVVSMFNKGEQFGAITIWPFIFYSTENHMKDKVLRNHEKIHVAQQVEIWLAWIFALAIISAFAKSWNPMWAGIINPFFIWYLSESRKGYYNIMFEKEAYDNQGNLKYLDTRKRFAFEKYKVKINKK